MATVNWISSASQSTSGPISTAAAGEHVEAHAAARRHLELVCVLQALVTGREVDVAVINRADPLILKQILAASGESPAAHRDR